MVSDQYRCIFVEIPKTGSTSISAIVGTPSKPHLNICQIANLVDEDKFESYFKFGFVRNPWDRTVSLYERNEGMQMKNTLSFEDFVSWMKFASSTCIHPSPHRYQLDWFVDPSGYNLMDYIGKFENIDEDWANIAVKIGAESVLPKLNVNTNRDKDYTKYYTAKTKKIISERFAIDIEYFEYRFGD